MSGLSKLLRRMKCQRKLQNITIKLRNITNTLHATIGKRLSIMKAVNMRRPRTMPIPRAVTTSTLITTREKPRSYTCTTTAISKTLENTAILPRRSEGSSSQFVTGELSFLAKISRDA
jgi:hypothetical protein